MPHICELKDQQGTFQIIRRGRINTRVVVCKVPENEGKGFLVTNDQIINEREGDCPQGGNLEPTVFRRWMETFTTGWGREPQWPRLLYEFLESEFVRERNVDRRYHGQEVFIDRTNHDPSQATVPEKRWIYELYHQIHRDRQGILTIGSQSYLLLGYEWPNQGRHRGRRADLVGLSQDGGLVVFEGKLAGNNYSPLAALLEAVDYLACLCCTTNFNSIVAAYPAWRGARENISEEFQNVIPRPEITPQAIVLTPQPYFDNHNRRPASRGWSLLAGMSLPEDSALFLGFACLNDATGDAQWYSPE